MRKVLAILVLAAITAGGGWWFYYHRQPKGFTLLLPENIRVSPLLQSGVLAAEGQNLPLAVSHDGRVLLARGNVLIFLSTETNAQPERLEVANVNEISDIAWMADGSLLAVSGKRLGEIRATGFVEILTLPEEAMRLAPATDDETYLFGGRSDKQRRKLYLLQKGGGLLELLRAEAPIHDVAGTRELTFVAVGHSILLLTEGNPIQPMLTLDQPVRSLAFALPGIVIYATEDRVGQVSSPGNFVEFFRGCRAEVQLSGSALYLYLSGGALLQCEPLEHFANLSQKLMIPPEGAE